MSFTDRNLRPIKLSMDGGADPRWAPNGDRVFYWIGDNLMSVSIDHTETGIEPGEPKLVVELPNIAKSDHGEYSYDISPEGDRFIVVLDEDDSSSKPELIVVHNWFEELIRLVPTE